VFINNHKAFTLRQDYLNDHILSFYNNGFFFFIVKLLYDFLAYFASSINCTYL